MKIATITVDIVLLAMSAALLWRIRKNRGGRGGTVSNMILNLVVIPKWIWNSSLRWLWIGIIFFLLLCYGRMAYVRFCSDAGYGIKTATIQYTTNDGLNVLFDLPQNGSQRVEFVRGFFAKAENSLVIFEFKGVLYEFVLLGQKGINRSLNSVTKRFWDMPFHKEKNLLGEKYLNKKQGFQNCHLLMGSEIEWTGPPYVLKIRAKNGSPLTLSEDIKYRLVDNSKLGKL